MTLNEVVTAFATVNENNEVVNFDFTAFNNLVNELVSERAKLRKENKEAIKQQKEESREANNKPGMDYYNSLEIGDTFCYKTADGTLVEAIKIETKSKSGLTAACELVNPPEGSKSTKRYPRFYQIVVEE